MNRFPSYHEYKNSGVDWLGEIPAHWGIERAKWLFRETNERGHIAEQLLAASQEMGVVPRDDLDYRVWNPAESSLENYKLVRPSQFVISLRSFQGGIEYCAYRGLVSPAYTVLDPAPGLPRNYYRHFLKSENYITALNTSTTGIRQGKNISYADFAELPCPIPPFGEAETIATFLDTQTATIDAAIDEQRRLIDLLHERRVALISHAVTKGLNPDAPMRDSGVEWLGEIPAHWAIVPLKRATRYGADTIKTGPFGSQLLSSEMMDGKIKVYNQRSVIDRNLDQGENYISEEKYEELRAFTVFPGDVLVTTRGTIGRCVIVPEGAELGILHPCLMRIQSHPEKLLATFLVLLIQESYLVQTQLLEMSNATTIEVIYSGTMRQVRIPLPPLPEQRAIVVYLDRETAKIDTAVAEIETAIAHLEEYRTALIAAAVTGKIRVNA